MKEEEIEKARKVYEKSKISSPIEKKALSTIIGGGITGFICLLSKYAPRLGHSLLEVLPEGIKETSGQLSESLIQKKQGNKRGILLDKIISYDWFISDEEIQRINKTDFIIEMGKTLEVIDRLARDDKVNYIANLLGKYFIEENNEHVDLFEESLNQLETLSYREIEILISLNHIEKKFANNINDLDEGELKLIEKSDLFPIYKKATNELTKLAPNWDLDADEMNGLLHSLTRSGFLKEDVATRVGYSGDVFFTTAYFEKFLDYILPQH